MTDDERDWKPRGKQGRATAEVERIKALLRSEKANREAAETLEDKETRNGA